MQTPPSLQTLYETHQEVRAARLSEDAAASFYQDYVDFVGAHAEGGKLLDVGCGVGWSTYFFASRGFAATGIDLNPDAFEPPSHDRMKLQAGNGLSIPFPNESFDVVSAYQVIEHVSDPQKMLDEMLRVVRPGGVLCIVGPNLLGLNAYVQAMTRHIWSVRPRYKILFRTADMPRHPRGNTIPELLFSFPLVLGLIGYKYLARRASFTMRVPDMRPPFVADNDASYYCNPVDLEKYFRQRGCEVLRRAALGRRPWTRMLAGGTWVAVRKAAGSSRPALMQRSPSD